MELVMVLHGVSVVTTGLFAGLMMTLVFIMHKQWLAQSRAEYWVQFQGFLRVAKGNGLVTVLTLYSFLVPLALSVHLLVQGAILRGALMGIAGLVFMLGCFVVTMALNFPIYNKVISWRSEADAVGWEEIRRRFHLLNCIRFASSLCACAALLVAALLR
ncbi:MAG: DUF1772 domain-containing protein [Myxococcales bacterium]